MSSVPETLREVDKTIVDRSSNRAGSASRSAVKKLRLGSTTDPKYHERYSSELLHRHGTVMQRYVVAFMALSLLTALLIYAHIAVIPAVAWASVTLALSGACAVLLKRFAKHVASGGSVERWHHIFTGLQLVLGIVWGSLFAAYPIMQAATEFAVLIFAASLTVMALAMLSAHSLRYGALATCLPVGLAVAWRLSEGQEVVTVLLSAVTLLAVAFFHHMANVLRETYMEQLSSRSERDGLIAELEQARSISDEARRRAEEANLAKSRFLATMSHELRTPLNAILGFSEIMTQEVMGPMENAYYKEYAQDIHGSGAHLLKLINEILDLSRVEAGRYELHEVATSLPAAAEESRQMVKLKADQKGVALIVQVQENLPQIWADERAMRQIILNLLTNAIKFTPKGGTVWLKIGWTATGGQYLSVKDTGPGIPAEEIPVVLSSFGQGSIAIKSAEQGTGLGLPIVQALVKMHDGVFNFTSELRKGVEATAIFPRRRVLEVLPPVDTATEAAVERRGRIRRFSPKKVAA